MKAQTTIDLALLRRRFAPLTAAWERQAKRIDALSLRERTILFLAIAAMLAALFDFLVLTPQNARAKLRADAEAQQATELTKLREQFVAASGNNASDPNGELRGQLGSAQADRVRLDAALRALGASGSREGLSTVLQRLLNQQPGLVLERLVLLDDAPVVAPVPSPVAHAPGKAASAPAPTPLALPGMAWQGVSLQVHGRYADIQRYLAALEAELPGLRWGEMTLSAPAPQELPRLKAQLFLLKVQP